MRIKLAYLCIILALLACPAYAELSNYQSADYVVGQSSMAGSQEGTTAYNLYGPYSAYSDGIKLYVAEYSNHRVLIYNTIPTSNNASADIVVGRANMTETGTSDITAYKFNNPSSVYAGGGRLYVADRSNNRVLIYDPIPVSNNASASFVLGPDAMTAGGNGTTAYGLSQPFSVYSDGTKLYVADRLNNRVLIYNSIPASNLASANVVVGQPDMTTTTAGVADDKLNSPYRAFSYQSKLYVADGGNNRVLIYDPIPIENGSSAGIVIGQANMTSNSSGTTAYNLYGPVSVYIYGTKLYVTDASNRRILIYNTIPTASNAAASLVVGQPDMITDTSGLADNKLNTPYSAYSDGSKLYVSDYSNNRVLIYDPIPTSSGASASVVVGQIDMISSSLGLTAYNLYGPMHAYANGTKLYISDQNNSRILIYDPIPTSNNVSASLVIGQQNMTAGSAGTTAYKLHSPSFSYTDGTKLYVADTGNNRVLIYNAVPTSDNASANVVLGPDPMTASGGIGTASRLGYPSSVYVHGTKLYISDRNNNRVLIYNSIPSSNLASADVVVGQPNMTSVSSGLTAYNLYNPYFASSDGTKLYIADATNKRVLIYNSIPTSNNASANVVVGQANMTSATAGTAASQFMGPACVYSNGTKLYVTDSGGGDRVLMYNSIPTSNSASADVILGTGYAFPSTASGLYMPSSAFLTNAKLYVADYGNNRVLIYNDAVGKTMTIEGNITVEGAVTAE